MKQFYFIAGLPRSGSTLLSNILLQNPSFYVSDISALPDLFLNIKNAWPSFAALKLLPEAEYFQKAKNVLRSTLHGFYENISQPIIFDKNRSWTDQIETLNEVLDNVKIIAPVREPVEILASFELLWRKTNTIITPPLEGSIDMSTLERRVAHFVSAGSPFGRAYNSLKDACIRGLKDQILFFPFELFSREPKMMVEYLYGFLEQPYFQHQFIDFEIVTQTNDGLHGYVDLHKLETSVVPSPIRATEVLGKDICMQYFGTDFWSDEEYIQDAI